MISKNFARCIAKISGDGNLYWGPSCRYVRYSNKCKELINEFKEDIKKEFGDINFTHGVVNSGTPFVQVQKTVVLKKFLQHLKSYKSNDIYIPDSIKLSNKSVQKEYLRALYDDEGSCSLRIFNKTKEWKRNVTLYSNSFVLLTEVKELLLNQFGISTNTIFRNNKNSNYDKCFTLSMTGKENFIKFKRFIDFKVDYKNEMLDITIESYDNPFSLNREGFEKIKNKLNKIKNKIKR